MFENRCMHCKPRLRVSVKPPTQSPNPSPPPGRRSPESSSAPRAPLLRIPPDSPRPVGERTPLPSPRDHATEPLAPLALSSALSFCRFINQFLSDLLVVKP